MSSQASGRAANSIARVEVPAEGDEGVNKGRHEDGRQDDLRQHLAEDKLLDRKDALEGDADENEGVDDLAKHA